MSLKAFALAFAGAIAGAIAWAIEALIQSFFFPELSQSGGPIWLFLILPLGFLAASVASLIVSLVWGLRVVKSRWYVLWWVIPAGLVLVFLAVLLFFAALFNFFIYGPVYSLWGNYVVFFVALIAAGIMTFAALRRETTLDQMRLNGSGMSEDSTRNGPPTPSISKNAESFLGVDPQPSGSAPGSPSSPEPLDNRLTRLSRKIFVFGLAGAIAGSFPIGILYVLAMLNSPYFGNSGSNWLEWLLLLSLVLAAAGAASLIVSLVCGLRVAYRRPHVLWWVIPAGLAVTLFVVAASYFVAVSNSTDFWGVVVVAVAVLIVVVSLAPAVMNMDAKRDQMRLGASRMTKDNARNELIPLGKFGDRVLVFAVVGIVAAGICFLQISSVWIRLDATDKSLDRTAGELHGTKTALENDLLEDYRTGRHQRFDLTIYEGLEQQIQPRTQDSAELRDARVRLAGMDSVVKEGSAAVEAQIRRMGDLEKKQQRTR